MHQRGAPPNGNHLSASKAAFSMRSKIISKTFSEPFEHVPLLFESNTFRDVFGLKNNKSLADTFAHHRYLNLAAMLGVKYQTHSRIPLGDFLLSLKRVGDQNYKKFLNRHGDLEYCRFWLGDPRYGRLKGIYCYFLDDRLVYIGRCRDSMKKRIDQGYGRVQPKNCYLDGQSTNCHLNARIAAAKDRVTLWLCRIESDNEIVRIERQLIRELRPEWNVQHS